ncbi:MAG: hypothetical protein R3B09_33565 [Nannocystaceae bacterium]
MSAGARLVVAAGVLAGAAACSTPIGDDADGGATSGPGATSSSGSTSGSTSGSSSGTAGETTGGTLSAGTGASDGTSGSPSTGSTTTSGSTSDDPTGTSDPATTGLEEGECEYVQVVDMPGAVHWVTEDAPALELAPLAPGEGFTCVRVEFDLQTLDNLDQLTALDPELCPEYLAIASVFGTTARGGDLATSFLRVMDRSGDLCVVGPTRLEVGNYLDYNAATAGPWPLGEAWRVVLEARPWVTRISFAQDGEVVGPVIEASLYPANIDDTRDPIVRLGLPKIVAGKFFPWYGATYANLGVWVDVAPPP